MIKLTISIPFVLRKLLYNYLFIQKMSEDSPISPVIELPTSPSEEQPIKKPIQIIIRDSEDRHKFRLNDEGLRKILTKKDVKNLPIAVLSVAGAFRKGKSFLINLFMNYLKENNSQISGEDKDAEIPMLFSWRGGTKRDTTGILAWPELFKLKNSSNGKEFALLILDTQGTFDDESSVRDNATIFALACMTSSKIVYNLTQQLQEDNLQHLALFTNYGKLALEQGQLRPFQSLCFLIRDWQVPYEYAYGRDDLKEPDENDVVLSGNSYLKKKLRLAGQSPDNSSDSIKSAQHKDLESVREHVRDCFENTECFLLPHPGLAVASSPKFNGQVKMIEKQFLTHALDMCEKITKEIKPKKVDGVEITSSQLLHLFQTYASIFEQEDLPEPKSMLQATAEACLLMLTSELKKEYEFKISEETKQSTTALNSSDFNNLINTNQALILTKFDSVKKLGDDELIKKFRDEILEDMKRQTDRFREQNENKRLAHSWRTPATILVTNILAQVIGFLLRMVFLGPVAIMFGWVQMMGWILIGLWSYFWGFWECFFIESLILRFEMS